MPEKESENAAIIQKIFDHSLDLLLVVSKWGQIIRVSPSCALILGYSPKELEGRLAKDFVYPADLGGIRSVMRDLRRGGKSEMRGIACRYVRKDKLIATLTWSGVWSIEAQQYFFIGRDISAETALEEIREQLMNIQRRLAYGTRMAIFVGGSSVRLHEIGLSLGSMWAAYVLITPPPNFLAFPSGFALARHIVDQEWAWAAFAMVAAVVKIAGLAIGWRFARSRVSLVLRGTGLMMSSFFWLLLSLGTVWGNPDTLFGGLGLIEGIMALVAAISLVAL